MREKLTVNEGTMKANEGINEGNNEGKCGRLWLLIANCAHIVGLTHNYGSPM
jgi:hypothetical protein